MDPINIKFVKIKKQELWTPISGSKDFMLPRKRKHLPSDISPNQLVLKRIQGNFHEPWTLIRRLRLIIIDITDFAIC